MTKRFRKVPYVTKPTIDNSRVNYAHPINRKLKHLILWNGRTPTDLVTNSKGTPGGTANPTHVISAGEEAWDFGTGGNSEVNFGGDIFLDCSLPCTIIFDIDVDSITSTYDGILELGVGSGSTNNSNFFISSNASYRPLTWRRVDASGTLDGEDQISDGGSTPSGREFIVCRYDGTTADFFVNGVFYAREASGTTTAQSGNTIFGRYGTNNEFNGRYHFWGAWERALTDAEIRAIYQNRFIGLEPNKVPVITATGDTNLTPTTITKTFTVINPTITKDSSLTPTTITKTYTVNNPTVTAGCPPSKEDFTTYTEVDPNSHITITSACQINFAALDQDEDAYVYRDYGAGFWSGDYEIRFKFKITSGSNSGIAVLWMMSDVLDDRQNIAECHSLEFRYNAGSPQMVLIEKDGGTAYSDTASGSYSTDTEYWVKVVRDETAGTLAVTVYSDEFITVHDSSMSLTLTDNTEDWRYLYPLNAVNTSTANQEITGYVAEYDTGLDVALTPTTISKTLTVYDPVVDLSTSGGSTIDVIAELITKTATVNNPTLVKDSALTPTVIGKTFTVNNPTVIKAVTVTPTTIQRTFTVNNPTVTKGNTLTPTVISKTYTVINPTITKVNNLTPTTIPKTFTVINPTVTATVDNNLTATLITKTFTVTNPTVTFNVQSGAVTVTIIAKTITVFNPTISTAARNLWTDINANENTWTDIAKNTNGWTDIDRNAGDWDDVA